MHCINTGCEWLSWLAEQRLLTQGSSQRRTLRQLRSSLPSLFVLAACSVDQRDPNIARAGVPPPERPAMTAAAEMPLPPPEKGPRSDATSTSTEPLDVAPVASPSGSTPSQEMPAITPPSSCAGMTLVDFDELFRQVSQDVASVNVADQPYLRYISLTNRQTAGVCVDALEPDRQALVKMLNMLATSARIYVPTAINADRTLYRIDLRDLGWDRAIAVQGTNFNDVWEAIAARNPYAVEFIGAGADAAKDGTQTVFPFMFADQMLAVAAIGQLYYAIIGVDVKETLGNFILNELQVDLAQALTNATSILAGTTKSRIARQDRVVRRDELVTRSGALWQAFDVTVSDSNSIFEAPFGVAQDGTEAIFTLPNGMLAFIIADANGAIVPESDRLLDASQDNFLAVTSVSCSRCHTAGVIPVQDEVRAIALANPTSYDSKTLAQVQAMYVSPEEFGRVASQDSQNFYQRALQFAQLPTDGEDPVSSVYQRFDQDMKLADAAGELGVTPDALKNNLNLLSPSLGVLADGSLDRDDFTKQFVGALCIVSSLLDNHPDPAACAVAARAAQ